MQSYLSFAPFVGGGCRAALDAARTRWQEEECTRLVTEPSRCYCYASVAHVVTEQLDRFDEASCLFIWRAWEHLLRCMTEDADYVQT